MPDPGFSSIEKMLTTFTVNRQKHAGIAMFLAMALLLSNWYGVIHNINHLGWQDQLYANIVRPDKSSQDKNHNHHSCIEFDAATLSQAFAVKSFTALFIPNQYVPVAASEIFSWGACSFSLFLARAPPVA